MQQVHFATVKSDSNNAPAFTDDSAASGAQHEQRLSPQRVRRGSTLLSSGSGGKAVKERLLASTSPSPVRAGGASFSPHSAVVGSGGSKNASASGGVDLDMSIQLDLTSPPQLPLPPQSAEKKHRRSSSAGSATAADMHAAVGSAEYKESADVEQQMRHHSPCKSRWSQLKISYPRKNHSPKTPEEGNSKQALAVAGVLEAFAHLAIPTSASIGGIETSGSTVPAAALYLIPSPQASPSGRARQQGAFKPWSTALDFTEENETPAPTTAAAAAAAAATATMKSSSGKPSASSAVAARRSPSPTSPTRRSLADLDAQYKEVLAAEKSAKMQEIGANIAMLFRRLKENTTNHSGGKNDSVLSLRLMKSCIKKIGLIDSEKFTPNDVDIVLSQLGVKQLTLFGFAFALTLCAERSLRTTDLTFTSRDSYLTVVDVLNDKVELLIQRLNEEHLDHNNVNPLEKYREINPLERPEVMKLMEREKKVFFAIYESYLPTGTIKAFGDIKTALAAAPFSSGGMTFSGVVNFGRDFQVSPELFSRLQLLEVFNSILLTEREYVLPEVQRSPAEEQEEGREGGGEGVGSELDAESGGGVRSRKQSSDSALGESISFPQVTKLLILAFVCIASKLRLNGVNPLLTWIHYTIN